MKSLNGGSPAKVQQAKAKQVKVPKVSMVQDNGASSRRSHRTTHDNIRSGTDICPNTDEIGVLVIDDHAVVRVGVRLLLEDTPGLRLAAEAANGEQALAAIEEQAPSIVLLDLELQNECGLELLPRILERAPESKVIILTGCQELPKHRQAITLGARGLVMKSQPIEVLLKAIRRVHAGELWIERNLMHSLIGEMLMPQTAPDPDAEKIASLTDREREIIEQIGEGLKNKQIAERLFISETTVRHHLTSIFNKLGVSDRLELIIYAYRHELVSIPRPDTERS